MTQRQYDAATAQALMKWAYQEYTDGAITPYIERDDGLYVNESFREVCPPGTLFDWTPADEMDWPGNPNPDTAPFLPIPFAAAELAACMLDGAGRSIQLVLDRRIGYPLDEDGLSSIRDRHRWLRDALQDAYALAAAAQLVVGEFDYNEEAQADELRNRYSDAYDQALEREQVMERVIAGTNKNENPVYGDFIPREEYLRRLSVAKNSVSVLKEQATREQKKVADKWKVWRKAMVRQLLAPEQATSTTPLTNSASNTHRSDFAMLATRDQLIAAFGSFTGMDLMWFNNLKDIPALLRARKVVGQGGRGHIAEPWFCPFEVMQWLTDSKRRKGRKLSDDKAWDLLERHFPMVYNAQSVADPRIAA